MNINAKSVGSFIKTLVTVLILAAGFFLMKMLASKKEEPKVMIPEAQKRYVSVDSVKYSAIETSVTGFGKVLSSQSVNLVAEVGGELMQGDIPLKAAQDFLQGQVIFRIDDSEARLNIKAQKSDFLNLISSMMADIKIDYPASYLRWDTYLKELSLNKTLPELPEINDSKEKAFLSNKKILSQYFNIKSAEERLTKYVFTAPYKGSIAELKLQHGTIVNPGTQIGRIIRTDETEAEIPVRAENIAWIEKGSKVKLSSQDKAVHWTGRVVRIGDFVDPANQSVNVYVTLDNHSENKIFEGFYLHAEFPGRRIENAMELPRKALLKNNQVYVIENGKLKLKVVDVKKMNPQTFIFSGLNQGELVVNESVVNAIEGMEVHVAAKIGH